MFSNLFSRTAKMLSDTVRGTAVGMAAAVGFVAAVGVVAGAAHSFGSVNILQPNDGMRSNAISIMSPVLRFVLFILYTLPSCLFVENVIEVIE
jgi:hypothetical protein